MSATPKVPNSFRSGARKILPTGLRQRGGALLGNIDHRIVRPLQGLLFDLSGGCFKADECVFEIPRDLTTRAYRSCFWTGEYEAEERELLRRLLRPDDNVMELGACLGIVSCVTNRLLRHDSKHLVVEANPKLIPSLERNRELNQARFKIENAAVSDKHEVTFYLHPKYIVGGSAQRETDESVTVPGHSIAELHAHFGPFNVLVMDVEGSEVEALPGAAQLLQDYRLVIIELHEWAVGQSGVELCRDILRRANLCKVGEAGYTEAWQRV